MPRLFLPAVMSGLLLWAAFFPLDLGPIGFFALVPWLSLVHAPILRRQRYFGSPPSLLTRQGSSSKAGFFRWISVGFRRFLAFAIRLSAKLAESRYFAAYVGGFAFFALATNWVRVAHPMMYLSWAGLSLVLPLFWVLGLDLIRRFDRLGVPLALSVPVAWVALEYFRMHFPTGFPFLKPLGLYQMIGFGWYFLGYTQHAFLPFIQIADLGGVYAVSFLIAAINGMLADWLLRLEMVRQWLRFPAAKPEGEGGSRTRAFAASAVVCVLVGGSLTYGFIQLDHPAFAPGPLVAAIQGSVPQGQKMEKGPDLQEAYSKLFRQSLTANPKPDMIVWPETCFAMDWLEVPAGQQPPAMFAQESEHHVRAFAVLPFEVPVLLGLTGFEWEDGREWRYNSALFLTAHGTKIGRYDKMHLVPFGEYVPLKETFPFMQAFTPYENDYSCRPGEHWSRFPLTTADGRKFTFACLICYEDSDPYLARQYVATEPVNFLVNISNDGWFDGTEEHEQHLAICRFRAIEARRSLVRSVNMGISAVIDSDGSMIALPRESWSASKKVEAVVSAVVPIDNRDSLYSHLGDWIPGVCWGLLVVAFVISRIRKQETPTV
jgi:apolipoprotein N-acyltransferase